MYYIPTKNERKEWDNEKRGSWLIDNARTCYRWKQRRIRKEVHARFVTSDYYLYRWLWSNIIVKYRQVPLQELVLTSIDRLVLAEDENKGWDD